MVRGILHLRPRNVLFCSCCSFGRPRTQRGTYTIQSQTIIFTFADGRRGMRTFYAPKAQQQAKLFDFIGLGWQVLYEDHYQNEP